MTILMKDVLALNLLKNADVCTGEVYVEERQVEWVSVIETPVESFVKENEFVLTSGVGCSESPDQLESFVNDVIQSGASGLAIALGPYIKAIPASVLHLANQHQFILLTLDWKIRFSDILAAVIEEIHDKKREYLEKIENIRKSLLEYILAGESLDVVANHVSKEIDCDVLIADKRGVILGKSPNVNSDLQDKWLLFLHKQLEDDGIYQSFDHIFDWLHYEGGFALQLKIHSAGNIQGYIIVGGFGAEPFSEQEHNEWVMLLEHVTTAVAIHFLHEQAAKETEWRLRDDFVWELSRNSIPSKEAMLSRAKSLGYHINLPYISLVAKPEQLEKSFRSMEHLSISFDHWLHECIRYIEEEAESMAKSMALKSMVTYQQHELIIFLEVTHYEATEQARVYISKLAERLQLLYPSLSLTWGIAKQYGYSCFDSSYQEAKRALEIGRKRIGPASISIYADTKVDRVIESIVQNRELIEMAESVLSSLLHYANERQIDLLHTFTIYHRNRSNVSQTARELNLHRQSLLYRLRKIESLTGCSLDDADDLFLLDLSVRLWLNGIDQKENEYGF
ncbi:PucR family transcriptional regulator [Halalkalibacter nanhaiisediminis]|uniref:Purine catabolism regulator n=1 Tax=Halalkalibacter nanhaiisediminis TaxID=688079 RepID=A0A562QQA5_9BACI|nr:PucR family transcriptional regulator [Halalkalibacter nanhaiisediminis]TWI58942.1 purine catabolism regulator [Halalkalibacter nanhaiisediminis]